MPNPEKLAGHRWIITRNHFHERYCDADEIMGKKRQRLLYAGLIILAAATAWAEPAALNERHKVVFHEDFEGEGDDFIPRWELEAHLSGRRFKRDTEVFREGRASLRIDQAAGQDMVTFHSPGSTAELGKNYRISFWVKSNDRFPSSIGAYPLTGGSRGFGLHGGSFVPGLKWRKVVCGGRVTGEYGFVGPAPTHYWWRITSKKKPVTLWIDDFKVEEGPVFAEQVGWTPVAEGRNLIPNGSFEVDPSRHYVQWGSTRNDRGPDQNWEFSEDAAFGSRSLKLPDNPDPAYGPCHRGPQLEGIHPLAFDSGDAEFTLSASVKTVDGRARTVTLVLGPASSTDAPIPTKSISLEMAATGQWTRHQKTFRLPRAEDGKCWLYIRGGDVFLDGMMLARGKSSAFVSRQPIEATLSSSKPWRIYEPGEALAFTLRAVRSRADGPASLELTLLNYRLEPIRTVTWPVDAEAGKILERKITLDPLPQGCYRAELRMAGKQAVLSEITFSILSQPRRVPYLQSNYGVDTHGGTYFNTYDWDLSPMVLRLGFHWARTLSSELLEDVGQIFDWRRMSPEEGQRAGELWVNNLKRHGFGILAGLFPRAKYGTHSPAPDPPKTDEEYADYEANLREIMARFGDRIDHWEVANEPWWLTCTPENYGRTIQTVVRVLREADPGAQVISLAGAANGEKEWIERAFKAGARDGVAGLSMHYSGYGGKNDSDTAVRYGQWREWALGGQAQPLQVWDSEEEVRGPSLYPIRVQSATGLQDLNDPLAYPAVFCRATKVYLCNSAMNVRTFHFNAEYSMSAGGFERGFWERDGGLKPTMTAGFLAAQMIQTMKGGGFYRTPQGLFGALMHDEQQSVLAVWSEKYTGTTQLKQYWDPFDMIDATPRPIEQMADIRDFFRDVDPVKLKVPDGVKVLDSMTVPLEPSSGEITVDIYTKYLVVPNAREGELLKALGADLMLPPIPR